MTNRTISPLRQRMVEDMNARQLGPHSQRSHIYSCERFASFLKRSPDTATADDVRRFQLHLMESGASIFHRIRHYGLFANGNRTESIAKARELLAVAPPPSKPEPAEPPGADEPRVLPTPCPCCGGRMHIIETFEPGTTARHRPSPTPAVIRIDTS